MSKLGLVDEQGFVVEKYVSGSGYVSRKTKSVRSRIVALIAWNRKVLLLLMYNVMLIYKRLNPKSKGNMYMDKYKVLVVIIYNLSL